MTRRRDNRTEPIRRRCRQCHVLAPVDALDDRDRCASCAAQRPLFGRPLHTARSSRR
jgi:hypothetical protein